MTPKELVETALRVLVAWNSGNKPDPDEVDVLKAAFPSSANLDIDELACQVIHDLSGRAFPRSDCERKQPSRITRPKKLAG
jgi:hypothetical protein